MINSNILYLLYLALLCGIALQPEAACGEPISVTLAPRGTFLGYVLIPQTKLGEHLLQQSKEGGL